MIVHKENSEAIYIYELAQAYEMPKYQTRGVGQVILKVLRWIFNFIGDTLTACSIIEGTTDTDVCGLAWPQLKDELKRIFNEFASAVLGEVRYRMTRYLIKDQSCPYPPYSEACAKPPYTYWKTEIVRVN